MYPPYWGHYYNATTSFDDASVEYQTFITYHLPWLPRFLHIFNDAVRVLEFETKLSSAIIIHNLTARQIHKTNDCVLQIHACAKEWDEQWCFWCVFQAWSILGLVLKDPDWCYATITWLAACTPQMHGEIYLRCIHVVVLYGTLHTMIRVGRIMPSSAYRRFLFTTPLPWNHHSLDSLDYSQENLPHSSWPWI